MLLWIFLRLPLMDLLSLSNSPNTKHLKVGLESMRQSTFVADVDAYMSRRDLLQEKVLETTIAAIELLEAFINKATSGANNTKYSLAVSGSRSYGLESVASDLDLRLEPLGGSRAEDESAASQIYEAFLEHSKFFPRCFAVKFKDLGVPAYLISLTLTSAVRQCHPSLLAFDRMLEDFSDIDISIPKGSTDKSAATNEEYRQWIETDRQFKIACIIVKDLLDLFVEAGLIKKILSSNQVVRMVKAWIIEKPPSIDWEWPEVVLGVLRFYGEEFDYRSTDIHIDIQDSTRSPFRRSPITRSHLTIFGLFENFPRPMHSKMPTYQLIASCMLCAARRVELYMDSLISFDQLFDAARLECEELVMS